MAHRYLQLHHILYRLFFVLTLGQTLCFEAHALNLTDRQMQQFQELPNPSTGPKSSTKSLRKFAKANPTDVLARLNLARALLAEGKADAGIEVLLTLNADVEPRAHLLLDVAYEMKKSYSEQIRILELLRRRIPGSKYLSLRLGSAYLNAKNIKSAVDVLKDCRTRFAESKDCYFALLNVYEVSKNNYETRILLTDMAGLFGSDPVVYSRLCKSYATNSFIDEGLDICAKAIRLQPELPDSHVYLALLKRYNKEADASERILKSTASKFPNSELAQYNLGQLFAEQKNFESARRTYEKCTRFNKGSDRCWLGSATTSFELKDFPAALAGFSKACQLDVKNRSPFRSAITQLRIQNKLDISSQYSAELDKCGINAAIN